MLDIEIKTVPQSEQRYSTVGDYFSKDGKDFFRITDVGNRKYEWMVAIHELVERALCEARGITNEKIDDFDFSYGRDGEPGDDPRSPYQDEHGFASAAERMLCSAMGLNWKEYNNCLDAVQRENVK